MASDPRNPSAASPLFLREPEIRRGIELLFFAHAELMQSGDAILAENGLGRAHHRALYFIARKPDLAIGELMTLLGITKQSLGRVLGELEDRELIARKQGQRDRRRILIRLTAAGETLETELFAEFRKKMVAAYNEAGPGAVTGFWTVLEELMPDDVRERAADLARRNV
ncbi:MarR family transcriptional regulator [Parasphingopyxis sp. CP4]|uniref:MarR family winged helix-turn-helix transcriptional regulator n=1 Tax=Parasphingopyxis sp. CP4 TaxID=2724527 RepID=UPI0015A25B44|nr:helix-turn-helix domain-containing protein [Parasphingopyxis sp. CP4]QLC21008.1 MarR family transcriptional regulator [Parasphingopyxis sp. CP4]